MEDVFMTTISAGRWNESGYETRTDPVLIIAHSPEDAANEAMHMPHDRWPETQGWFGHMGHDVLAFADIEFPTKELVYQIVEKGKS